MKIIPNPDCNKYSEVTIAVNDNFGFCPCAIDRNDDTKCPCKEFREQTAEGLCTCGRYMKVSEQL